MSIFRFCPFNKCPMYKHFVLLILLSFCVVCTNAQKKMPYQNPAFPVADRVKDLLQRMTSEEKFWQLFMIPGDLGNEPSRYNNGIFGFQVSAASLGEGASSQILQYGSAENALMPEKSIVFKNILLKKQGWEYP